MDRIVIGDDVEVTGDTQHFILKDPMKTYTGKVIGKAEGQVLIRLDESVGSGPGAFRDTSVNEEAVRLRRTPRT